MIIQTAKELKNLKKSGRAIRDALDSMAIFARPGTTTAQLSHIGNTVLTKHQSKSAPPRVYKFPGDVCISINEEALHGIPGDRALKEGDLLKLDIVAERHGWYTDAAITVLVGACTETDRRLKECAENAFLEALHVVKVGAPTNDIGKVVESVTKQYGFSPLDNFGGHGIGRTIHEPPFVPNYHMPESQDILLEGMVITIEPIIAEKSGDNIKLADGWTIVTRDGGRTSHHEHTLVVTKDGPVILTVLE